ncbi:SHOCT domain-containing protein [Longitalea luteola]|uniref:SHOCT domain-containing protein n=1 Tax=Longitalea luteola TaxID=2812563 RepID=UPI001A956849|nr:SHOCT domain-containing protein [Longitalea luteola]
MNLLIMNKQRRLVLIVAVIGIIVAAFGTVSSGNGLWLSLMAPLALIVYAMLVKNPGSSRSNGITNQPVTPAINKLEEMIKLIDLRDEGKISDEEYQERRANLIYYS